MTKIAVMGCGTVSSGVAGILDKNRDAITGQTGQEAELKYVLDLREFRDSPVADKIVHDFKVIRQDEEVKIVVEIMGGLNPVYSLVKVCLMAGKHVVTSSKALVAAHGTELLAIARRKNVNFLSEVSVGEGIPITRPFYRCLIGECTEEVTGILNGITDFILTKVDKEGESFENTLREARDPGRVERNPEADVEGHDTCYKIAILTAMATGKEVDYEDIYIEDITWITDIDLKYAGRMGTSVKLFGISRIKDGRVLAHVAPMMINKTNPLYPVDDIFNGILVKGNMPGTSMFYSSDAGKPPTGSAVVANIIEAVRNLKRNVPMGWIGEKQATEPVDRVQFGYFVRVAGSYRNKEQDVKSASGQVEVTKLYGVDEPVFLTAQMTEGELKKGAVSYDARERERPEYGIKQMMRAVL